MYMMPDFPSQEWADIFCKYINESEEYRRSAQGWVWPILFTVEDLPPDLKAKYGDRPAILVKLENGRCLEAKFLSEYTGNEAPFIISGKYDDWRELIEKGMNPVNALVRRKIRLVKGNFSTILRYPKAAIELVNIAKKVGI